MYIIKSVIPFNLLVDIDMGLIKYVQIAFPKSNLFYPGLMDMIGSEHTEFLQYALINRKFSNPLSTIMKEEKMLTAKPDKMKEDILNTGYKEVLKLSTSTALFELVCRSFFVSDILQFDILCNSSIEENEIRRRVNMKYGTNKVPCNFFIGSFEDVDINNYGTLYIKDIHDIDKYRGVIEGKNLLIANYQFNKEYNEKEEKYLEIPLMDVINKYSSSNDIKFIDVYPDDIVNGFDG